MELLATGWTIFFFFAWRPVATVTTTTTTMILKNDHRKNPFRIRKNNNSWPKSRAKTEIFHGNLEQKWGEFKKMDGPPFVLSIFINQIKFVNALCDNGYLFYGIFDSKFVTKCGLKRMKIIFRNMQRCDGLTNGVCNEIISIRFDINGHVKNSFFYVAPKLKYGLILSKPWMKKTVFNIILNPNVY